MPDEPIWPAPSATGSAGSALEGVNLIAVGHSYLNANALAGATPPARYDYAPPQGAVPRPSAEAWPNTAARRMGMRLDNRSVAGDRAVSTFGRLYGGNAMTAWTPGEVGLVVVEAMLNDERFFGTSANGQQGWVNSMRAILALMLSGSIVAPGNGSHVRTGAGWSSVANALITGGTLFFTGTQNDRLEITATPVNGEITIITAAVPGATTTVSCVLDPAGANTPITPAGGSAGTFNYANQCASDVGTVDALGYVLVPLRFTGISAGSHVFRITKTDAGANFLYDGGHILPSTRPPVVMCAKDPSLGSANYALNSPYNNGSDTVRGNYNTALDALVAEFSGSYPVSSFDLNTNWVFSTMVSSLDNTHPNTLGARQLASTFQTAAVAMVAGYGGSLPAGLTPASTNGSDSKR